MREVCIIGVGQTPVGKYENVPIGTLAASACRQAMLAAGISQVDAIIVGNMMSNVVSGQCKLGPLIASLVGSRYAESLTVSAACASGASAVRQGYLAVASGAHERVLAVGVEKMTGVARSTLARLLASAADAVSGK